MGDADNEAQFRDLFVRHHRAVVTYFLRRLPDEAVALDAAEDVFVVAWRRLDQVPSGDSALPWLYGVARNVLSNHRRSRARRIRLGQRLASEPVYPGRGPELAAIGTLEHQQLRNAMQTLREKDREVLRLAYWEQLPHDEIGKILGCSTDAVHVRRHRAVKRLRKALVPSGHNARATGLQFEGDAYVD